VQYGKLCGSEQAADLGVYSSSLAKSINFYELFGFTLVRQEEGFAELSWGENFLYLEETSRDRPSTEQPAGNIRILVPDVDRYWNLAKKMETKVFREIGDREYGLRDFTIFGPDGISLRFASRLERR
jgi:hypothetical protein